MMIPDDLVGRLRLAESIIFLTGAGTSRESGIPTFRDHVDGLWGTFDPMEVATPYAFEINPQLVWDFYAMRAEQVRNASPNAAHLAIAELAKSKRVTVVTQNVDSLHQRGGSEGVIELHGSLLRLKPFCDREVLAERGRNPIQCPVCHGWAASDSVDAFYNHADFERIQLVAGPVPHCPCCDTMLRPSVTWYGEELDSTVLKAAEDAVQECEVLICVGCSLEVQPAASLPYLALQNGSTVIEVNPNPTSFSEVADVVLVGTAVEVLPKLLSQIWGETVLARTIELPST